VESHAAQRQRDQRRNDQRVEDQRRENRAVRRRQAPPTTDSNGSKSPRTDTQIALGKGERLGLMQF
jgi:hypothetical protein